VFFLLNSYGSNLRYFQGIESITWITSLWEKKSDTDY